MKKRINKNVCGIKYETKKDLRDLISWAENEIMEYENFIEECNKKINKLKK